MQRVGTIIVIVIPIKIIKFASRVLLRGRFGPSRAYQLRHTVDRKNAKK